MGSNSRHEGDGDALCLRDRRSVMQPPGGSTVVGSGRQLPSSLSAMRIPEPPVLFVIPAESRDLCIDVNAGDWISASARMTGARCRMKAVPDDGVLARSALGSRCAGMTGGSGR